MTWSAEKVAAPPPMSTMSNFSGGGFSLTLASSASVAAGAAGAGAATEESLGWPFGGLAAGGCSCTTAAVVVVGAGVSLASRAAEKAWQGNLRSACNDKDNEARYRGTGLDVQ